MRTMSDPRPRSITTDDALLKNLYAFNFVSDGIPSASTAPNGTSRCVAS